MDFSQEEPVHNQEGWKHQTVNISIDLVVEKSPRKSPTEKAQPCCLSRWCCWRLGFESGIVLAKCCCNKDDRDRGFSSVRGTHSDVDLAEKLNQVINHVRRGMKVSHHLCLARNLWLHLIGAPISNVLAHNTCAGRTRFIAACCKSRGEEEGGRPS